MAVSGLRVIAASASCAASVADSRATDLFVGNAANGRSQIFESECGSFQSHQLGEILVQRYQSSISLRARNSSVTVPLLDLALKVVAPPADGGRRQ